MAHVSLTLSKPKMVFRRGGIGTDGWRLSFESRLANSYLQSVTLEDGSSLDDLHGTVAFQVSAEAKSDLSYWGGSTDIIFPSPPSYLVNLICTGDDLSRLLEMIKGGLPLESVNFEADALEYGWEPDGSGKKWDKVTHQRVEITSYVLYFGEPEEPEPDYVEKAKEPVDHIPTLIAAVKESNRLIGMLLVVVFVAVLAWRFWPR